jgi:HlyD family secretion protein
VVTYTIIVDVENPDELLKPGMTAQTRIVVATKEKVIRLPTAALRFRPDEDSLKAKPTSPPASAASAPDAAKDAAKAKARADDDGVLTALNAGHKIYRIYTVGERQEPKQHDVTIGIANTRFTELITGDLKAGDEVITRSADPAGTK